ncbi:hypothetical protein VD17_17095 [Pseudomonas fluorescens]|uniref:Alpha/beta hydrolase fold-3 domain-containing protein n=1 Tax=Pseudomonas fluorescens TaxID=294 RepID=A0A0F4V6Y6_PSEFL|nr:hypothetical protein VD17_17095 [Pseudomonas fluorescens]
MRARSLRSRLLCMILRLKLKPKLTSLEFDVLRFRAWLETRAAEKKPAESVSIRMIDQQLVKGEWHVPVHAKFVRCILYLHGGGYIFGSPRTCRTFTTRLAELSGMPLFSLDYRLAPENPFPAALNDAIAAYKWLLAQGFKPENIVLAGDSAGGGLAVALLHAIRAEGHPTPAGCILMSPYTDLLATGESVEQNSKSCVMFNAASIRRAAAMYLGTENGMSPLASPLYGDFPGFPPISIYVSDNEVLRDDSLRLAQKLDEAAVPVHLSIWKGQPHVWPIFYPVLPEADICLKEMARFANKCQDLSLCEKTITSKVGVE